MSDITEGLGSALEGAMAGRAVEPRHGATAGVPGEGSGNCLNCGTTLVGLHCHACGQKAGTHRSLKAILHDLIHGVLHLDGKFWHTLPLLTFKPGELTRRYIDGERAKFVSPMAIFLFSVFLMFAVFQMVGLSAPTDFATVDTLRANVEKAQADAEAKVIEQRQLVAEMPKDSPQYPNATARLKRYEKDLEGLQQVETLAAGENSKLTFNGTGIKSIDEGLIKKWRENPGLMLYKLQSNGYKFSWLLIPISIPFLWLLFAWKRRFKAYDHAIFVTYSIAFMSLLFIVLSVLATLEIGGGWIFGMLAIIPPLHIYKQLRGTYDLSRFSALWRTLALMILIIAILIIFLWLLVLLGAF
jgi:hypothetical protein